MVSLNIICVLSDFGFVMKMLEIGVIKGSDDIIIEVCLIIKIYIILNLNNVENGIDCFFSIEFYNILD